MSITLYDVSKHSGVSIATVSRVINGSDLVREQTRKKVEASMKALGFRPNHAARALAGRQTKTIGVILPDISGGFYADVLKGLDRKLSEQGYHVLTSFSHGHDSERELAKKLLLEQRTDALILMNLELSDEVMEEISSYNVPIVLLDRPSPLHQLSSVSINNEQGIVQILQHLGKDCGYKSLGILAGPEGTYDADLRLKACREHAERFGLEIIPEFVRCANFAYEAAYDIACEWFQEKRPLPDAIIGLNDLMAIGCLNACREHKVQIPHDLGIVGFDDISTAQYMGLTSIHVPLVEMGTRAAELALANSEDPHSTQNIILNTRLVIRDTCKPL